MKHLGANIPQIGWTYLGHALLLTVAAVSYDLHAVFCQCSAMTVYYAMSFAANCVEKTAYYKLGFATDGILFTALLLAGFTLVAAVGVANADAASRAPTHDKAHIA